MRRLFITAMVALGAILILSGTALAQPKPEFKMGFKSLSDQIPAIVGEPVEDEQSSPSGDSLQRTTRGLMVWRKVDNWTAFTDGQFTWVVGPTGVQRRLNAERFPWEAREMVVGALVSLTGSWSSLGESSALAADLAQEDINGYLAEIGSKTRLRVEVRDTKLDPAAALAGMQELASLGARVVVGPQSSSEAATVKPFADENSILVVSQSSTAGSLAEPDNLFRFTPNDALEGQAIAALMGEDGIEFVVPVWRADAGNEGLQIATRRSLEAMGAKMAEGVRYDATTQDFGPVVAALLLQVNQAVEQNGAKSVGVYLAGFDEVTSLFNRAQSEAALGAVRWYGSDGVALSEVLARNAQAASFAARVGYPNPIFGLDVRAREKWEPLSNRMSAVLGREPEAFALGVYDALWVAALANQTVGESAPFDALKQAFVQTANSYYGVTAWTGLDDAGDRVVATFDYWVVREEGGAFRWVRVARYDGTPGSEAKVLR